MRSSKGSLADYAYQLIRDRILTGEVSLGAVLSRRRLAEEFGVSFVPVTEAMQRLERDGLLESQPRLGTRVRIPTSQDIRDRFVIREALESQSARLFAENASSSQKRELLQMAKHLDSLYDRCAAENVSSDFWVSVHREHMSFHTKISEYSGCRELCRALENNHVLVFNWLFDTAIGGRPLPHGFHSRLAKELCEGSPEVADAAMRKHVNYGLEETLQSFKPRIDQDQWRLKRNGQHPQPASTSANAAVRRLSLSPKTRKTS